MSKKKNKRKPTPQQKPRPQLPQVVLPQSVPVDGTKATISLSIIVKNEANVIERMLNTVYPILDYYVVVDTGSTDGTQDIVRKFFEEKGIPGEVIDHPWKNFEDARNTALNATKGKADYGFWIDADEQLIIDPKFNVDFFKMNLSKFEGANVRVTYGGQKYYRMQFFSTTNKWRWYGPVHEVLVNDDGGFNVGEAEGIGVLVLPDGNSWTSESQTAKYEAHAKILLDYVENDPNKDPRWVFYLAQSYRDAGTPENQAKALEWYEKRSQMTSGFWEEVYFSMLMVSSLKGALNYPTLEILESYLKAGKANTHRAEHLMPVILHYHSVKEFDIAYMYSSHAMKFAGKLPFPHSALFIDDAFYLWKIYDMHIISCWYSGRREEAWETYKKLEKVLNQGGIIPEHEIPRIKNNKQFFGK
jgi:glycosyltransferase involved in cell wall biosynthesis